MTQAASLQELAQEQGAAWASVDVLVVNLPPYDDALTDLTDATDLPVLQDTTDVGMGEGWGGSKSYIYVLDPEGYPRFIHYNLDFVRERDRLVAEVQLVMEEAR